MEEFKILGETIKKCEKFHRLEVNATDCAKTTLRKIQLNEVNIFMTTVIHYFVVKIYLLGQSVIKQA